MRDASPQPCPPNLPVRYVIERHLSVCVSIHGSELSKEGLAVRTLKDDVGRECKELGNKTPMSGVGAIAAQNLPRDWAPSAGVNTLRLDTIGNDSYGNTTMTATAYRCP
jgi:hypothetical protein